MKNILKKAALPVTAAALVIAGALLLKGNQYTLVSLLAALLACTAFALSFERRELSSRYAVVAAVMTALTVSGRFIFAPLPGFSPAAAMVMLSGIYLSPEGGFLTGALSVLISNMYFGHGAWTPFQMLAWGLIGFTAGLFSSPLKKNRLLLLISGAAAGAVYSLVMDIWTVTWYSGSLDISLYKAAVLSALPFTAVYALSNVVFLLIFGKSFGRKLSRAAVLIER